MTETTAQRTIIKIEKDTNLVALGVQPGWFARSACCMIWQEVQSVHERFLIVAARDPKKGTELVMVGDFYSAINDVASSLSRHDQWIKLVDGVRSKSFHDKFFPELDKLIPGTYVPAHRLPQAGN
ncbi:TPA: hypothetical protein NIA45_004676 [Pseudomonas aeruginosa]|nr:hypothetical protein [Pseudomonas aeruginosa]